MKAFMGESIDRKRTHDCKKVDPIRQYSRILPSADLRSSDFFISSSYFCVIGGVKMHELLKVAEVENT
ncbi:hypothetical protein PB01_08215 [Psychrobacillus glaciei]|uniref:Uncharacterized protein n=1 Tax=Psychrobacillus glaciei TaxID=2283160 RepID=A0A5J6SLR8_9BACI|nr:hypothetical protein PB01_08215 [Psychrobacillus glaciei]